MTFIKSLFISAFLISASFCLETKFNYDWVDDDCGNEDTSDKFASLYFFFNTNFENGVQNYRIGPMVNIPCDRQETFTLQFEVNGNEGTIKDTDNNQKPMLYQGSYVITPAMDLGEAQEYIESDIVTLANPVIKARVDVKFNSAMIKLDTVNKFMLEKLEEYGIDYDLKVQNYEVNKQMKEALAQKLNKQGTATNMQMIELTEAMKQDILNQLSKGQNTFTETNGNQKIQVTVQRKMYRRDSQGQLVEIDNF